MLYELRVIYLELSIPISMNRIINKAEMRLFPSKVSKLKIVLTHMRGHTGFLLEVQSHAGMFSPRAANPT